ncbi:UNVERIFIED_CONTAM: hypothetical protein Slati_2406600 [Sesamum latifolium]|uniref:Uncharacterized protein n=1 Tax=Sesamum latifolium TaxID=2727402 RepID=A0AAW2WD74_9LAMI
MAKGSDEQAVVITALSPTRPGRPLTGRADGFLVTSPLQRHVLSSSLLTFSLQTSCKLPPAIFFSVRFVGENNPGDDPSEATSRMAALSPRVLPVVGGGASVGCGDLSPSDR